MKLGSILKSCGLLLLCSALCTGVSVASSGSLRNEDDTQTAKPTRRIIQDLCAAISEDSVERVKDILDSGGSSVHGIKFIDLLNPLDHPRLCNYFSNPFPPSILLSKIFSSPRQAKEEKRKLTIYIKRVLQN